MSIKAAENFREWTKTNTIITSNGVEFWDEFARLKKKVFVPTWHPKVQQCL